MKVSSHFLPLLDTHKIGELNQQSNSVLGTWPDLTLAYLNEGWSTFARQNGGQPDRWHLGTSLLAVIPNILKPFYRDHFSKVLREARPWEHDYECSSPKATRIFHMIDYPLRSSQSLLIIHSLRRESSYAAGSTDFHIADYRDKNGPIHQCAHCRRVRRNDDSDVWDWVREFICSPSPNTSHGLCAPCFGYYYNENRHGSLTMISTAEKVGAGGVICVAVKKLFQERSRSECKRSLRSAVLERYRLAAGDVVEKDAANA
jgi:hypothetical protein